MAYSRSVFGALLALSLAACGAAGDCLPEPNSPERQELRARLRTQVHYSQCPGLPAPTSLASRIRDYHARKEAFLARVEQSRFADDLARARREDQEASENVFEADCAFYPQEIADEPENVKNFTLGFNERERLLGEAEKAFERLDHACPAQR